MLVEGRKWSGGRSACALAVASRCGEQAGKRRRHEWRELQQATSTRITRRFHSDGPPLPVCILCHGCSVRAVPRGPSSCALPLSPARVQSRSLQAAVRRPLPKERVISHRECAVRSVMCSSTMCAVPAYFSGCVFAARRRRRWSTRKENNFTTKVTHATNSLPMRKCQLNQYDADNNNQHIHR